MTTFTFKMTEAQAQRIHERAASHMQALKNWTASAVESGKFEYAQELVAELREYEAIYAGFNMKVRREIAESSGKPLEHTTTLRR